MKAITYCANDSGITVAKLKMVARLVSLPSSLPGDNGLFGDVGERIFSRVDAMDGVIGVLGGELT